MRFGTYAIVVSAGAALSVTAVRDARACGGCFHEPTQQNGTVVTDHRMVFAVSPSATTLYDQIKYSGSPASFAWVLPTHGAVTIGLSSDVLFTAIDQATTTTILAPPQPACPPCGCAFNGGGLASNASAGGSSGASAPGVQVIAQQVVGPYDTVQLHPTSTTDTKALSAWLTAN
ncbi:MAG TPA: DUF2330 domain-containing protein, partial [Polyangiaceae bacterium]|nr:DUF2330 domain-containing protein [Polyangiaceae bacterium]